MISVLIADDSFLMRTLIADMLRGDPEIRVVGTVSDGEQVIEAARRLEPDVITMDVAMPKVNGLEATKRIMEESGPRPIILMVSAFSADNASAMLDCLHAGAFECVVKPSGAVSLDIEKVRTELLAKIRAAARASKAALKRAAGSKPAPKAPRPLTGESSFPTLILIGASTGGPPVLEEIFASLPAALPAAVLIVQHMPAGFTASMAQRIDAVSALKVKEAQEGDIVVSGMAFVAPGDYHMQVVRTDRKTLGVHLTKSAPVAGLRPSIDVLLQSACETWEHRLIGVVLTGMGNDGTAGMRMIHKKGGHTIVQSPSTCIIDSMAQSVIDEGCADEELPPQAIADRLYSLATS